MRKIFIAMLLVLTMPAMAQRAKEEIKADRNLAASNYLAYPGPKQKLTKAPEGYSPYYISHYGRHGSRYLINPAQYSDAVDILSSTRLNTATRWTSLPKPTVLASSHHAATTC